MIRSRTFLAWLLALLFLLAPAVASPVVDGHWQGAVVLPTGKLELDVDLATRDQGLTGDISIPIQGLRDYALSEVLVDGNTVRFKMPGIPGDPAFEGELSGDAAKIIGTFRQGGAAFPFELLRENAAARARAALADFDAVAEAALKDWSVPGLGIAVVAGGELVYARGFGLRDVENKLPMTPDSLFAIGSTTKAMTTTLLGILVDEGKLAWDRPLTHYLPGFRLSDELITARITPRDLVTHRSGLPRHDLLWYNNNRGTREEMVARLAHLELTADLREKFQYNNLAFLTAGYLASKLSGTTWEEALSERLLTPLGMSRTVFSVAAMQEDADHALPYKKNDQGQLERIPYRPIDLIGPAGSLNSSVTEMSRWLLFNLKGGKVGEKQLIQPATLADIHSPHMVLQNAPAPETRLGQQAYGMGWMVAVYRGHKLVEHGGGIDGFITSVSFFPEDGIGIVTFTNRASNLPNMVSREIADRLLGLEKIEWIADAWKLGQAAEAAGKEAEKKVDALRVAGTRPSHPIAAYAGSYEHPGYGQLDVTTAGENHGLQATFNDITAPLEHWHYDVWNGAKTSGDPTLEQTKFLFHSDFEGNIHELAVPLELTAAPIVFKKVPDRRLSDPAYLGRFVGTYLAPTGQRARVELAGNNLTVFLPGQPLFTLVPDVSGRFNLRGLQGFSVAFASDASGKVTKILFHQPNGIFESQREE